MTLRTVLLFNESIFCAFAAVVVRSSPRPQYRALTRSFHRAAILRFTDDGKIHQKTPLPSDREHQQTQDSGSSQSFSSTEQTFANDAQHEEPQPNTRLESPALLYITPPTITCSSWGSFFIKFDH